MRSGRGLLVLLGGVVATLALAQPTAAAHGWYHYGGGGFAVPWGSGPVFGPPGPRSLPGYRYSYPPGSPLTFYDGGNATTYCLSQPTGYYYACGYSRPATEPVLGAPDLRPALPPAPEREPSPPSGVLLFRLPQDAEAKVDGVPVGLSGGLGALAVTPGRHRVALRVAGTETEHAINVSPRVIFTITPTAIVPSDP